VIPRGLGVARDACEARLSPRSMRGLPVVRGVSGIIRASGARGEIPEHLDGRKLHARLPANLRKPIWRPAVSASPGQATHSVHVPAHTACRGGRGPTWMLSAQARVPSARSSAPAGPVSFPDLGTSGFSAPLQRQVPPRPPPTLAEPGSRGGVSSPRLRHHSTGNCGDQAGPQNRTLEIPDPDTLRFRSVLRLDPLLRLRLRPPPPPFPQCGRATLAPRHTPSRVRHRVPRP
jgi:hypothetical protein